VHPPVLPAQERCNYRKIQVVFVFLLSFLSSILFIPCAKASLKVVLSKVMFCLNYIFLADVFFIQLNLISFVAGASKKMKNE